MPSLQEHREQVAQPAAARQQAAQQQQGVQYQQQQQQQGVLAAGGVGGGLGVHVQQLVMLAGLGAGWPLFEVTVGELPLLQWTVSGGVDAVRGCASAFKIWPPASVLQACCCCCYKQPLTALHLFELCKGSTFLGGLIPAATAAAVLQKETHALFPDWFKCSTKAFLLCHQKQQRELYGSAAEGSPCLGHLPTELVRCRANSTPHKQHSGVHVHVLCCGVLCCVVPCPA